MHTAHLGDRGYLERNWLLQHAYRQGMLLASYLF